jgi:hypothetical protein
MSVAKIRGNDLGIGLQASDLLSALNSELDGFQLFRDNWTALEKDLTLGTLGEPGHIHLDDGDSGAVEIDVSPGELTIGADVVSTNDGPLASVADVQDEINAYTTTATSAGTLTLTAASKQRQFFTGTTTHTVVLPVASTMVVGQHFVIENNSTRAVTINSSGGNLVATPLTGSSVKITCVLASGTSAASWDVEYVGYSSVTAGKIALRIISDTAKSPQQVLDETGEYLPAGNITWDQTHPLFLSNDQVVRGEGQFKTSVYTFYSGSFAVLGFPRGLISDDHWTGTGFRTKGDSYLISRGLEWDLGPAAGWDSVHTFRIKFRATKHYGASWHQSLCGIQGIDGGASFYGNQPRPWTLWADGTSFRLEVLLSDGTVHSIAHPTANVADTTIDIDWTVDLVALFGSGKRLANNSLWTFGCGRCPHSGGGGGYWGTSGVGFVTNDIPDITIENLELYLNGSTTVFAKIYATASRIATYAGGPSIPLISASTEQGGRHLYIVHSSASVSDSSSNVSISDLTISCLTGNTAINMAGMLGGGLKLDRVRVDNGLRGLQSLGIYVCYPLTITNSWFTYQQDCAIWLTRGSGIIIDAVDMQYIGRTLVELLECGATIRGDAQLVPGNNYMDQVFSQIGGNVWYIRQSSDYEGGAPADYPPLLRLTGSSTENQWGTIAVVQDCNVGSPVAGGLRQAPTDLVTIEGRWPSYTGKILATVDGVDVDETGVIDYIDGGNASSF